jgi:O-antigen/teichoic acid export membrane protein
MKKYITKAKSFAMSATAKDTGFLFVGNWLSAIWGLFFKMVTYRAMNIAEFGIFYAALNLSTIMASLSDVGISSGSVNFVAEHHSKNNEEKANEYTKAAFFTRLVIVLALSIIVILLSKFIAPTFLATKDYKVAIWAAIIPLFLFPDAFFPFILQAKRKFAQSTIIDNAFYIARLIFASAFYFIGRLNMPLAFWSFGAGFVVELVLILHYVKIDFLFSKPKKVVYNDLLKFSSWLGVNRIISSISGKVDVQMLAMLKGAVPTGIYSIPSSIASFIVVLAGSYSSVLAPRMAAFGNRDKEKEYLIKSTLALIPLTLLIIFGIAIAKPFILLAFGNKSLSSVNVFYALALSQIPFLFTTTPVTAIIYSIKKTIYIGILSFFQLAGTIALDYIFIPKYGVFGPTITYAIANTLVAVYVWIVVIRYYWGGPANYSK